MPSKSPDEVRQAVKAAFDAMSTWQTEIANSSIGIRHVCWTFTCVLMQLYVRFGTARN